MKSALRERIRHHVWNCRDGALTVDTALDLIMRDVLAEEKTMDFGRALDALKEGAKVSRAGWNGKGMFAYLVPANSYPVQTGAAASHFGEGSMVPYRAYLALKTADDDVATWAPSCSDVLADDWEIVR